MSKPTSPSCTTCRQTNCLINNYCSKEWKLFLDERKLFNDYKTGQLVFQEGSFISCVGFIYEGKIKVFSTAKNNKQSIFRLASSGEVVGLRGFYEKQYLVSAATIEDTSLCFFEKEIFIKTVKENSEFAWQLLEFYAHELSNFEIRLRNISQLTIKGKVAETLLMVKNKFGKLIKDGEILLNVELSRQEMADIAGISTSDVVRSLTFFSKEQIIDKRKKKIIILNQEKLSELVLSDCCDTKSYHANSGCFQINKLHS